MDEYNLTDEQKRILTGIAEAYVRNPQAELVLPRVSPQLVQNGRVVVPHVTIADLYALDDEGLVKRWKDDKEWHYCKPTKQGLDAVRNGFRRPAEQAATIAVSEPPMIAESLKRFRAAYPDPSKVAFLMIKFGRPNTDDPITVAVRETLAKYGMLALRADDVEYHEDLYYNVATYMHGCGFGIAVFERLETGEFNPNVSLEFGYMRALRKRVCVLKDATLQSLHADLVGKLYRTFDPQAVAETVPNELSRWLKDQGLLD